MAGGTFIPDSMSHTALWSSHKDIESDFCEIAGGIGGTGPEEELDELEPEKGFFPDNYKVIYETKIKKLK